MLLFSILFLFPSSTQLRKTVFDFAQKELAPKAGEIDRENNFAEMRVSLGVAHLSFYEFIDFITLILVQSELEG